MTEEKQKHLLFSNHDLWILIFPLVIELALKLIVGLIDSVMVSSVGEAAVSGVSLMDSIMQLLIYIFAAMASGGAVVAGQYLGAKVHKKANQAAGELMWLNALLSVVIMAVMLLVSDWMLTHVFGQIEQDVYENAKGYFGIVLLSVPAIAMLEAGTAIFRTMGNSKTTMKISLLMKVMNAIGNAILIYGCSMGTRGAALSTLVSRWTAAILVVCLLLNPERQLSLERSWRHHFDWQMSKSIMTMGVPGGVENGVFQLGKIVILGLVATFGTAAITANAVSQTLASLEMIPGSAIQLAIVTVIARCIGAGDYEQTEYFNKKLLKISYVTVLIWSVVLVLGQPLILKFYNLSEETTRLTFAMFRWHALGAVLIWPLSFDLPASLRATGDVRFPMFLSIFSMWVFRFGGAYLLSGPLGFGAVGVWMSMAFLDWGFRALCFSVRWKSGKWKAKGVVKG